MIASSLLILISTVLVCLSQSCLMNFFIYKSCELKVKSKASHIIIVLTAVAESLIILFSLSSKYFLIPILLILIFVLYTNILYKGVVVRNIFLSAVLVAFFVLRFIVNTFFDTIVNVFYNDYLLPYDTFGSSTNLFNFSHLCAHLLCLFIIMLIMLKVTEKIKIKNFSLVLTVPTIAFLSIIALMLLLLCTPVESLTQWCVFVLIISLLLLTVLSYVLIYKLKCEEEIRIKEVLLKQKEKLIEQSLNEVETIYNKDCSLRHNLKNSNTAIVALIENGDYNKAKELLLDNETNIMKSNVLYSKNHALNLLLNTKLSKLNVLGVDVKPEIMTDLDFIDSRDICVIFGNLLDNIYDYYCNESTEKIVVINVFEIQGNVVIKIENKIEDSILSKNPSLQTTKEDSQSHGFGIEGVRQKILFYNGAINICEENGMFIVSCIIPKPDY